MNDDVISRQATIDVVKLGIDVIKLNEKVLSRVLDDTGVVGNTRDKFEWGRELLESCILGIENLPSAQPEIIRCKDCKYNANPPETGNALCDLFYGMTDQYGFCHRAERRSDGSD